MGQQSPYNHFKKRLKRIKHLYDYTMHCYAEARELLKQSLEAGKTHVPSKHGFASHHHIASTLNHAYPEELRSILLVRLVTDLEVYLVSTVREIGQRTSAGLRPDARVEKSRGELLAMGSLSALAEHLVEQDCRMLTSGGFEEIKKYFDKHLGMNIVPPNSSLVELREIHARRHLIVHRGGAMDAEFVKTYSPTSRLGAKVEVPETLLARVLVVFGRLADHVKSRVNAHHPASRPTACSGDKVAIAAGDRVYLVRAQFKTSADSIAFLDPVRVIPDSGNCRFGECLVRANVEGTRADWSIAGTTDQIGVHLQELGKLERAHFFRFLSIERVV